MRKRKKTKRKKLLARYDPNFLHVLKVLLVQTGVQLTDRGLNQPLPQITRRLSEQISKSDTFFLRAELLMPIHKRIWHIKLSFLHEGKIRYKEISQEDIILILRKI